jgi:hypothetical protein
MAEKPYWGNPTEYESGWYEVDPTNRISKVDKKAYLYYDRQTKSWYWKPSYGSKLRSALTPEHQDIIAKIAIDPYLTPHLPKRVLYQYRPSDDEG